MSTIWTSYGKNCRLFKEKSPYTDFPRFVIIKSNKNQASGTGGKEDCLRKNRGTHKLYEKDRIGEVQIADEVVAVIAGLAATETDGVAKMSGNITNEIVSKLGMKKLSKGVKVTITGTQVDVTLNLVLNYGVSIPKTSQEVQDKVKSAIETMTGLTVSEVNIRIAGIQMDYE